MPRTRFVVALIAALAIGFIGAGGAGPDFYDGPPNRDGSWSAPCSMALDGAAIVYTLRPESNMVCELRLTAGHLDGRCWEVI